MFVHAAILSTRIKLGVTYFFNSFARGVQTVTRCNSVVSIVIFGSFVYFSLIANTYCL
jgi:hypothetical protein